MNIKTITLEEFNEGARAAVLAALDGYMRELTGCDNARGATDADLPALFAGLDTHMGRVASRFNALESTEAGSAALQIVRPLGFQIIFAGSDISGFQKASENTDV